MNDPSEPPVSNEDLVLVELVKEQLADSPKSLVGHLAAAAARLELLSDGLTDETLEATVSENVDWLSDLTEVEQRLYGHSASNESS